MVLPYYLSKELSVIRLIPPEVKEERYQWLRWIGDYSYSNINADILPTATLSTIQYVQALDHIIREVVIAKPPP